ncbi:MAG: OmpA family protein [Cyclobacteriaceae bacterium]|nr:OmpA family protein [Cyclobacteriaceae bacterium]
MGKCLALAFLLMISTSSLAQNSKELAAGYYTVVGAYDNSKEDYAIRYVQTLNSKGHQADYGYNASRSLYFVYLQSHNNLKTSLEAMKKLRLESNFKDAWVRVVPGVIGQPGEKERPVVMAEPVTTIPAAQPTQVAQPQPTVTTTTKTEVVQPVQQQEAISDSPAETKEVMPEEIVIVEEAEEKIIQPQPMNLGNSEIFLSLFNAANNRIIDGDVQVIDTDRGKLLKTVKGNEYLTLPDPKNESGKVSLICDVFGYRKLQLEISHRNPQADTALAHVDMMGLSFVVSFDLVRYVKGDIRTLSHVYFFNDAAIMIPESRYEINQLLQMMTENQAMKIRLHGHTNGHYHGKIIKMGPEKSFFAVGKDAISTVGSAKDLSYERAEVIREYLIANGIAADRVEVKGWGGKKPLYDKHSANARRNVRVEVEVLAN